MNGQLSERLACLPTARDELRDLLSALLADLLEVLVTVLLRDRVAADLADAAIEPRTVELLDLLPALLSDLLVEVGAVTLMVFAPCDSTSIVPQGSVLCATPQVSGRNWIGRSCACSHCQHGSRFSKKPGPYQDAVTTTPGPPRTRIGGAAVGTGVGSGVGCGATNRRGSSAT